MTTTTKASKLRVGWEFHQNDSRATMHVDDPMFVRYRFSIGDNKCTEREEELFETLENIRGVREVSIWKYQVSIQRGGVFAWDEITPAVEDAVRQWLGCETIERVRDLPKHTH